MTGLAGCWCPYYLHDQWPGAVRYLGPGRRGGGVQQWAVGSGLNSGWTVLRQDGSYHALLPGLGGTCEAGVLFVALAKAIGALKVPICLSTSFSALVGKMPSPATVITDFHCALIYCVASLAATTTEGLQSSVPSCPYTVVSVWGFGGVSACRSAEGGRSCVGAVGAAGSAEGGRSGGSGLGALGRWLRGV